MASRLTIAVLDEPRRVAIVENTSEADRLWARWARLRYRRGKPIGGALIDVVDSRRSRPAHVHWFTVASR